MTESEMHDETMYSPAMKKANDLLIDALRNSLDLEAGAAAMFLDAGRDDDEERELDAEIYDLPRGSDLAETGRRGFLRRAYAYAVLVIEHVLRISWVALQWLRRGCSEAWKHATWRMTLRQTVRRGEIQVLCRPKVTVDRGELAGVELGGYWEGRPFGGYYGHDLERMVRRRRLVQALSFKLLDHAANQARLWSRRWPEIPIMVILPAGVLSDPAMILHFLKHRAKVAKNKIHLGISEKELLRLYQKNADADHYSVLRPAAGRLPDWLLERLRSLDAHGVRLVLTQYSARLSLAELRRLPFQEVRLDSAFIRQLDTGPGAEAALARAAVRCIRALDLQVSADGVSSELTRAILRTAGVDSMQGPIVSGDPLTSHEFDEWARRNALARSVGPLDEAGKLLRLFDRTERSWESPIFDRLAASWCFEAEQRFVSGGVRTASQNVIKSGTEGEGGGHVPENLGRPDLRAVTEPDNVVGKTAGRHRLRSAKRARRASALLVGAASLAAAVIGLPLVAATDDPHAGTNVVASAAELATVADGPINQAGPLSNRTVRGPATTEYVSGAELPAGSWSHVLPQLSGIVSKQAGDPSVRIWATDVYSGPTARIKITTMKNAGSTYWFVVASRSHEDTRYAVRAKLSRSGEYSYTIDSSVLSAPGRDLIFVLVRAGIHTTSYFDQVLEPGSGDFVVIPRMTDSQVVGAWSPNVPAR